MATLKSTPSTADLDICFHRGCSDAHNFIGIDISLGTDLLESNYRVSGVSSDSVCHSAGYGLCGQSEVQVDAYGNGLGRNRLQIKVMEFLD